MSWERLPHYGTGAELRAAPSERVELLCYEIGYEIGHKKGTPLFFSVIRILTPRKGAIMRNSHLKK